MDDKSVTAGETAQTEEVFMFNPFRLFGRVTRLEINMSDVKAVLEQITADLARINAETKARLDQMQAQLDDSDEVGLQESLNALKAQVEALDALAPPIPVANPEPETEAA